VITVDEALWAFGRGTGVVALALLSLSMVLGVVNRSGRPLPGLPRFALTLVHRDAALLASVFTLIHVVALFLDPQAQLNVVDFVVPFLGASNPLWLGLGTLAGDVLIALMLTGLLRRRFGFRVFRFVHWFAYAMWPIAILHSFGDGTDAASTWFNVVAVLCVVSVVSAVGWRLTAGFVEFKKLRTGELP
jgi:sulfoxide reductase heme-binding subunit YedZ